MSKTKRLIASSASREGLEKMIGEYFFNTGYKLLPEGKIYGLNVDNFRWELKNKRYRFISVEVSV